MFFQVMRGRAVAEDRMIKQQRAEMAALMKQQVFIVLSVSFLKKNNLFFVF